MKIWTKLLTMVLVFGLAGAAQAKGKKEKPVKGKITAVALDGSTITIESGSKKKPGESHTYKLAGAAITIDGASKVAKDLQVGELASIKASGDSAQTVTAVSAKGGKKKKKA